MRGMAPFAKGGSRAAGGGLDFGSIGDTAYRVILSGAQRSRKILRRASLAQDDITNRVPPAD